MSAPSSSTDTIVAAMLGMLAMMDQEFLERLDSMKNTSLHQHFAHWTGKHLAKLCFTLELTV